MIPQPQHFHWRRLTKNIGWLHIKSAEMMKTFHESLGKNLVKSESRLHVLHTKYVWLSIEIPKRKKS